MEEKGEIWVDMPHLGEKEALPERRGEKTLTREERERLLRGREKTQLGIIIIANL